MNYFCANDFFYSARASNKKKILRKNACKDKTIKVSIQVHSIIFSLSGSILESFSAVCIIQKLKPEYTF